MALTITLVLWRCKTCGFVMWVDPTRAATNFESGHSHAAPELSQNPQWEVIGEYLFKML